MNKKLIAALFLFVLFFSLTTASFIGEFPQNKNFEIRNYCSSADCTYMNLTQITYPNGSILFLNEAMTKQGQGFNYTWFADAIGDYSFITCANPQGEEYCEEDTFKISRSGKSLQQGEFGIYFTLLLGNFFILCLLVYGSFKFRYGNFFDNEGDMIQVAKSKYPKIFCIWFSYVALLSLLTLVSSGVLNYIGLDSTKNFIMTLYLLVQALSPAVNIGMGAWLTIALWKDILYNREIKQFGKVVMEGKF